LSETKCSKNHKHKVPAKFEESLIQAEPRESVTVAVVYEDTLTRDRAMVVCDELVQRFWAEVDFEITWWRESYLADSDIALAATDSAVNADLIVFSTHANGELSAGLTTWIETWLDKRQEGEGALIGLIGTPNDANTDADLKHRYLTKIAERGKLDYLSSLLPIAPPMVDESIDSIHRRADQVTAVLEQILHYPTTHQPTSRRTFED
jgi:hypothetical protein